MERRPAFQKQVAALLAAMVAASCFLALGAIRVDGVAATPLDGNSYAAEASIAPAPTSTPTTTPTATPAVKATSTGTASPNPTATAIAQATGIMTMTPTTSAPPTDTATPSPTVATMPTTTATGTTVPTPTGTATPSPTDTPTPTDTPWPTYTPWPTDTPVPTVTIGPAPANDDINSATLISTFPFTSSEDTTGATVASDDPVMGPNLGVNSNTVWFSLTPGSGGTVTADTFGSSYDTIMAAFTGQRGSLKLLTGNDDANSSTRQSQVTFGVQAGTTYYIEVAQYGSPAGGQLTLNVNSSAGAIGTPTATAETTPSATSTVPAGVTPSVLSPTRMVPADASYFPQTGFRVNLDPFWDYFLKRGGVRTFGYPVSREFTLQGYEVQFFQRAIMQIMPNGTMETMNLLQSGLMPYARINGSTFPLADPNMIQIAPSPGDRDYAEKAIVFIQANVPDSWNGLQVNFLKSYMGTVRYEDAFPQGDGNPALLPLFDLEMLGLPTSKPAYDPANHNFVYQRFQRGILHYDASTGATQALLLADYLKAIMIGKGVPLDLQVQVKSSLFYMQYDPTKVNSLARPAELPNTDLTDAFEPEVTVRVLLPSAPRP